MSEYAILHINKIKTSKGLLYSSNHNFRKVTVDNVNPERTKDNRQLVGDNDISYVKVFKDAINESPYYNNHEVAKNAVLGYEVMLTVSREMVCKVDLDKWCEANVEWLKKEFGEANVKNAVLHLDEETPHIHALVVPLNEKGRLSAKQFINGKMGLQKLQDRYAERMAEFGLQRGIRKTRAKHKTMMEFYGRIDNALSIAGKLGEELKEDFRRQEGETEEEQLDRFEYALSSFVAKAEADRLKMDEQERKLQELSKRVAEIETLANIKNGNDLIDMLRLVLEHDDDETNKNVVKMVIEYAAEKYEILKQREQAEAEKLNR